MSLVILILVYPFYAIASIPDTVKPWITGITTSNQPSTAGFLVAVTADSGKSFATNFYAAQKIDVFADVKPAVEDVGKQGVFYLVANYNNDWFMKNMAGEWIRWDENINNLVANTQPRLLQSTENLVVAEKLSGLAGVFKIFIGYKTQADITYSPQPFIFFVINPASLSGQQVSGVSTGVIPTKASFSSGATADSGNSFANSFDANQKVDVLVDIHTDPGQIGMQASIYLVARLNDNWYMKTETGQWSNWDRNLNNLVASINLPSINANENLLIATQLDDLPTQKPGLFNIYAGYKTAGGDLNYSPLPLEFRINPVVPPTPVCTPPQVLQDGACVTPCILPKVLQNGACELPTTCTPPQVLQDGACITPCILPKVLKNGVCELPITCTPPQVLENNVCVTPKPNLSIQINSPVTLLTVGSTPQTVKGTVSDPNAQITINGAVVANSNGQFEAAVNLDEGHNTITARAIDANGNDVSDVISLSLDMTPPYITVESPKNADTVRVNKIAVSGLINDIVRGTVAVGQAHVSVNGIAATISNRSYLAENVPLSEGENTLKIDAADNVGNTSSLSIKVSYKPLAPQHIALVSGQDQAAKIKTTLANPLAVKLVDDKDQPVTNKPVIFRVTESDGVVGAGTSDEGQATVVKTNDLGIAATPFKLGSRVGNGNQRVRATSVGFDGEVQFYATATIGTTTLVTVNSGNNQRGAINQALPQPLVVAVVDDGANVVQGAKVEFKVTQGSGKFQNDQTSIINETDSDGRATAEFTLGAEEGLDIHRVTATLQGSTVYAGFTASALKTGDAGKTSISGVVLDNQDNPLPKVTVRVDGTTRQAETDTQGQFKITEAPVGSVHLIADGSTTTAIGEWPTLAFNLVTVAGADNPLSSPIYLVKLDTINAKQVGDKDVTLTLPEVPGFALEVKAGSVTFPDGKKTGKLSVTQVNASKIPMSPPNGMQPQFIVTIQPVGAKFDPPAPLTLPNVDGHKPGAAVEMYSYDHDLEEFVAIGLGTVSTDGSVIKSNDGVGVIKAGWHCGSQPGGFGCGHDCPICQDCDKNCNCYKVSGGDPRLPPETIGDCNVLTCVDGSPKSIANIGDKPWLPPPPPPPVHLTQPIIYDSGTECKKCITVASGAGQLVVDTNKNDECCNDGSGNNSVGHICNNGSCTPVTLGKPDGKVNGKDEDLISFKTGGISVSFTGAVQSSNCEIGYEWNFTDDGKSSTEPNTTHTYTNPGEYTAIFSADCKKCSPPGIHSDVVKIKLGCPYNGELQQNQPILDLTKCPNRIPNPSHKPSYNGCGGEGASSLIPDNPMYFAHEKDLIYLSLYGTNAGNYTNACNGHDICYDTCNSDKSTCDTKFGNDMDNICYKDYADLTNLAHQYLLECLAFSSTFESVVRTQERYLHFYDSAQKEACNCCY